MKLGRRLFARLARNRSGTAMTEFALALPFVLAAGLGGTEMVNYTVTKMKVNDIASHLADNASRVGDTSTLMNRKIFESDVNDIFLGSNIQASKTLGFYEHGRAIISSLEVRNAASGQQYIHWQRCMGKKVYASSYGNQNNNVDGMGPAGEEVTAAVDEGVIFVEVAYDYQPLVSERFIGAPTMPRSRLTSCATSATTPGSTSANRSIPTQSPSATSITAIRTRLTSRAPIPALGKRRSHSLCSLAAPDPIRPGRGRQG